jgi:hypothetical protein
MSISELSTIITTLAILLAGIWTLYRFGISRERYPKLQFDLDLRNLGSSGDKNIVELVAVITNKGITRQHIHDFKFNILVFEGNMPFDLSDEKIERRLKFKDHEKGLNWDDPKHTPFVDGGMRREFTYVTALDADVQFVMIYSKFKEVKKGWLSSKPEQYHISRTFPINKNNNEEES